MESEPNSQEDLFAAYTMSSQQSQDSPWLGGHGGIHHTPAADRIDWVVPPVPSEASSEPSRSSAVVTVHDVTSFTRYEQVSTTAQTGMASMSSVPMPGGGNAYGS